MKASPPLDAIGSVIAGRYRVLQLLGRGGMAAVYKAKDERSGKELAIKRVAARDVANEALERKRPIYASYGLTYAPRHFDAETRLHRLGHSLRRP